MKQLVNSSRKKDYMKQRLAVLRLEMDYELAVLYEAMQEQDVEKQATSKKKLNHIREELMKLNAL
ncbi:hypothetical protein [Aeribacillus pallidus]|uniref:hypothetical protein n=1 Tax=Aeribacillus pallidus TaxID=33936 RepID=UPI001DAAC78E|nr:hypothetical protein [Bacillus sp. (in: firmicutes)]